MSAVIKMMRTPLSDDDLRKILGNNIKIVLYPDLSKHNNIRELLNNPKDCCIILYEEKHLCGHWTCLTRNNDNFTFFDSYGFRFDSELKWLSWKQRIQLNEAVPYLTLLLQGEDCDYNKTKYQEENPNIETCGDHVCHYLHCFLNLNMDLKMYHDYMVELRKNIGHSYDYIVALWVKDILNK